MVARKLPEPEVVIALYRDGASSGEIAEQYDVSPSCVTAMLKRNGEPRRSQAEAVGNAYKRGRRPPCNFIGEGNPRYIDGKHARQYRDIVKKEKCDECGRRKNLGIHHIDFDHYNNDPENLEVLCVSCHMSLHKQAYWDAVHAGEKPPKSNGPIGWKRD